MTFRPVDVRYSSSGRKTSVAASSASASTALTVADRAAFERRGRARASKTRALGSRRADMAKRRRLAFRAFIVVLGSPTLTDEPARFPGRPCKETFAFCGQFVNTKRINVRVYT